MTIDIYNIIKSAVKDALKEHAQELGMQEKYKTDSEENSSPLLTIKQFSEKHPFASQASLRSLIFHSEYNGFHIVFLRVGSKILIDEKRALEWFKNPPPKAKAACYQSPDMKTIYKYKK